jgi:hypothetical protein
MLLGLVLRSLVLVSDSLNVLSRSDAMDAACISSLRLPVKRSRERTLGNDSALVVEPHLAQSKMDCLTYFKK